MFQSYENIIISFRIIKKNNKKEETQAATMKDNSYELL